jgi:iron complex transport system ATP-binding protein
VIRARQVSYRIGPADLIRAVDLDARPGEVVAILGPNGAGKTTLLRLLAREIEPTRGDVMLNDRPLSDYDSVELARLRAVLPQSDNLRFGFSGLEVAALGRYPWGAGRSAGEAEIVRAAMQMAGAAAFAARPYPQLSAGERARVQLARVLAQVWQPVGDGSRYLLLDEPTANLDLAHQHEVLGAIRRFAATGVGVLMVLHDLNLAAQYADHVVLLREGAVHADGPPREVLNAQSIGEVFGVDVEFFEGMASEVPWIAPRPRHVDASPSRGADPILGRH